MEPCECGWDQWVERFQPGWSWVRAALPIHIWPEIELLLFSFSFSFSLSFSSLSYQKNVLAVENTEKKAVPLLVRNPFYHHSKFWIHMSNTVCFQPTSSSSPVVCTWVQRISQSTTHTGAETPFKIPPASGSDHVPLHPFDPMLVLVLRLKIVIFAFNVLAYSSGLYHRRKREPIWIQQQSHEMASGRRLLAPERSSSVGFYVRQSGSGGWQHHRLQRLARRRF